MKELEIALMVAERAHANQTYGKILPYMYHIKSVVEIAQSYKLNDNVVIACALHDVIEDSDITYNDIMELFGKKIADIVYAVTDEMGHNRKERKAKTYDKINKLEDAVLVKLCDRIANVRFSKETNNKMYDLYISENRNFIDRITDGHMGNIYISIMCDDLLAL